MLDTAIVILTLIVVALTVVAVHRPLGAPGEPSLETVEIAAAVRNDLAIAPAVSVSLEGIDSGGVVATPGAPHTLRPSFPPSAAQTFRRLVALPTVTAYRVVAAVTAAIGAWILLKDIGKNPVALFCDEAMIGYRAHELVRDRLRSLDFPVFYQHFGHDFLGALPLYATGPFTAVFGPNDMAIRLSSAAWSAAAIVALVGFVRRVGWTHGEVGVALFALSPVFIHLARVNFGHAPSLFMLAAGLYCYARSLRDKPRKWHICAGIAFGLSIYGYAGYMVAAPIVMAALFLGELVAYRLARTSMIRYWTTSLVCILIWIPVAYRALFDDDFFDRINEKQGSADTLLSVDRLARVVDAYPKYFELDYLFRKGEDGWLLRHSVPGAGLLPWVALPLLAAGIVGIFRLRQPPVRLFGVAALAILVLYPVPDAITTSDGSLPYTLSVFPTMIGVAVLAALGVFWISVALAETSRWRWLRRAVPLAILALILSGAVRFMDGPYAHYPLIAAGWEGWQYGPRDAIDGFTEHRGEYDRYLMDGDFNMAYIFLDLYLIDDPEMRRVSMLGGPQDANLKETQLIAIRAENYATWIESGQPVMRFLRVIDTIYYPNGEVAMYLIDARLENDRGIGSNPR